MASGMEIYFIEIRGTRPLLVHAPVDLGDVPSRRRGEHLDPKTEAERYLYRDLEGKPCIPAINVKACLRDAGRNYRVRGRRSTFAAMIRAGIDIEPFYIPILDPDTGKIAEWVVDIRPVVVQRNRILRARPRFDKWMLRFKVINKDPTVILRDAFKKILVDAGKWIGLGDFRPEFGLFEVTKFEVINGG